LIWIAHDYRFQIRYIWQILRIYAMGSLQGDLGGKEIL